MRLRVCPKSPARASTVNLCAVGILCGLAVQSASAHDFTITQVVAVLKADATYDIDVRVDLDALALGVPSALPSSQVAQALRNRTPEEFQQCLDHLRHTLRSRIRVRVDGVKQDPSLSFPEYDPARGSLATETTVLGTTARLSGRIAPQAAEFSFGASRSFPAVHLTILDEVTASGVKHILGAGQDSPPYRLDRRTTSETPAALWKDYLRLGFEHILPKGLDHILFVLGLFLLTARLKPLLWQVTAFTVAHSVTLALAMLDIVTLPPRVVEPLISLSISYVAVENLLVSELKPWRPAVVFLFGLLHGLGFAGVLHEIGLPQGQLVAALISFNVGVELGQLAVVLIAFAVLGWFRHKAWYRRAVTIPLSALIALVGAYWTVQRLLG